MEKSLGQADPSTMATKYNLASRLKARGDLEVAEKLLREVLEAEEKANHPHAPITKKDLASMFQARGDLEEAEKLCQEVLEAQEKNLGQDHPDTLTTKSDLATLRARLANVGGQQSRWEFRNVSCSRGSSVRARLGHGQRCKSCIKLMLLLALLFPLIVWWRKGMDWSLSSFLWPPVMKEEQDSVTSAVVRIWR